jgi:Zn-dependent protease
MGYFSLIETRDILISVLVLCVVFSYPEFITSPSFFFVSLLVVGIAFMGHELSHKFVAIRQGLWSEYRMWPQGIMMALLFSIATGGMFVFAAPGAVYFRSGWPGIGPGRKGMIKISMAGITFNIVLMWAALVLFFATGAGIFSYMALINGWLAIFNLIPVSMLDGQKLMKLDKKVWSVLFSAAMAGFVLSWLL